MGEKMGVVCELFHMRFLEHGVPEDAIGHIQATLVGDECSQEKLRNALLLNGLRVFEFLDSQTLSYENIGFIPWALLLWEREMLIAEDIASVRRTRSDLLMSGYSIVKDPEFVKKHKFIPVSIVSVKSKEVLKYAALESDIFKDAWTSLCEQDEQQNWICLCDEIEGAFPYVFH